jgi:hypothetical protein
MPKKLKLKELSAPEMYVNYLFSKFKQGGDAITSDFDRKNNERSLYGVYDCVNNTAPMGYQYNGFQIREKQVDNHFEWSIVMSSAMSSLLQAGHDMAEINNYIQDITLKQMDEYYIEYDYMLNVCDVSSWCNFALESLDGQEDDAREYITHVLGEIILPYISSSILSQMVLKRTLH